MLLKDSSRLRPREISSLTRAARVQSLVVSAASAQCHGGDPAVAKLTLSARQN